MSVHFKKQTGFTIVELLIVIVVIGILAAIIIVAFSGVQQRTLVGILQSDLRNAATQLELAKIDNNDQYPTEDIIASLPVSDGVTFDLTSTGSSYCLTAFSDNPSITSQYISSTTNNIQGGACDGHAAPSDVVAFADEETAKLIAADGAMSDRFGHNSVAVYGNTALVGAYVDDDDGSSSGSAYVFVFDNGVWAQQAKLTASDAGGADIFGSSVALYGDTAVIGAPQDDDGGSNAGAAYVFTRSGSSWSEQAKLIASDASFDDNFGQNLAIHGNSVIVGVGNNDDSGSNSGSAYIFNRSGSSWSQQAKLTASDAAASDLFGISVSLYEDTALVGAFLDDDDGSNTGSVYVFSRSGSSWSQVSKLNASDAAPSHNFGITVHIDGDTAIIGATGDSHAGATSGSAYIFTGSGGSWSQQAKLTASDAEAGDNFSSSVVLTGDVAYVSAPTEDEGGSSSGAVYIFVRSGSAWSQQIKLTASDAAAGDQFGHEISASTGNLIVGSPYDDNAGGNDAGAAYIFE